MNTVAGGSATGQVLTWDASLLPPGPAWTTSIGGGGQTTNISTTGTSNITNIGNATSTTNLYGTVIFETAPSIPLPENNMWVGNNLNVQAPLLPQVNSVLITDAIAGGTPQWASSLPIAIGGTNSNATPTNGQVAYGNGTKYQFTTSGTTGQVLQYNSGSAPTWVSVNSLISSLTVQYTVLTADETAGYALITPSVPGYNINSKIMITYQTATGPAQSASVSNQTATQFRVYSGAMTAGDIINYIIVN